MKSYTLWSHERPIKKIRFNRDGDMFFTCSDDKRICAWSKDLTMMGAYDGPGACKSCAISHNTEYIVGCYVTEGFCIFEAPTGTMIHNVKFPG